jgi:hypothetical protein
MMAANLSRDRFAVDYFYCDAAPYIGSAYKHPDTDADRLAYMETAGVKLVKFTVGFKDVTKPTHDWVNTDFWEVFDQDAYDLVQTATAGPAEYPYVHMTLPVVEYVTLSAGVNRSRNVALTIHLSQWQRRQWAASGGDLRRSAVIPIPAEEPASGSNLRAELDIPEDDAVAGFHQRAQDEIFSPIPLEAFAVNARPGRWFVVMGGSGRYREQAAHLDLVNVRFIEHHGAPERISRFLNTLDVFAHGRSDGETFGTVFAEAMMHGKPCISHRSPIANGQVETMGPAGLFAVDGDDYAAKLGQLFSDDELRERLARKARPHAQRYYSLPSCVERLEHVLELVAGRTSPTPFTAPMPYGQSDLGFLVAGDVDDPASVAHHVVAGPIPQEPAVDLLGQLLSPGVGYHEAGTSNTLLALTAASASAVTHLHAPSGFGASAVAAGASLNNWEERLFISEADDPSDVPISALRETQVVVVNNARWAGAIVPRLELDRAADHRPLLLLSLGRGRAVRSSLAALGYEWRRIDRDRWYAFVHPAGQEHFRDVIDAWCVQRRKARWRAAARAPLVTLARGRRRARKLAAMVLAQRGRAIGRRRQA